MPSAQAGDPNSKMPTCGPTSASLARRADSVAPAEAGPRSPPPPRYIAGSVAVCRATRCVRAWLCKRPSPHTLPCAPAADGTAAPGVVVQSPSSVTWFSAAAWFCPCCPLARVRHPPPYTQQTQPPLHSVVAPAQPRHFEPEGGGLERCGGCVRWLWTPQPARTNA